METNMTHVELNSCEKLMHLSGSISSSISYSPPDWAIYSRQVRTV